MRSTQTTGPDGAERMISVEEHMAFADFLRKRAGINLGPQKRQLLSSRLQRRMRSLKLDSFGDYRRYLMDHLDSELGEFINSVTTNLTAFFRENHHFDYLRRHLDGLADKGRPPRIWSAGCSTGEEPYTLGMVMSESRISVCRPGASIVATDIDTRCLAQAARGVYAADSRGLSDARLARHFLRGRGDNEGMIRVRDHVRELIDFRPLNLLDPWTINLPVDIIFCRNVVIYFDSNLQRTLFDRFADALKPGGLMFIGHSENLMRVSDRYESLGHTIYRKRQE